MIYLSAQPDDFYFIWQLKLQIYNFSLNGIDPGNIHILVGYDPQKNLSGDFANFINENKNIQIYAYADTRVDKFYAPSIRPHIIAKHFRAFPYLQQEIFFYHDSDIIFKTLPNFDQLKTGNKWYVSDTRSYLNCKYIKSTAGDDIFKKMCTIVGVTKEQVETNDLNAGGAQYLLKKTSVEFWEKIEKNCAQMFHLLTDSMDKYGFCNPTNTVPLIQPWYTDMWVIWWSAIYFQEEFEVHKELDFAWVYNQITDLDKCKILHYTGPVDKNNPKIFRKTDFIKYTPFYTDLSEIDQTLCAGYLKATIDDYLKSQLNKRIKLKDVTFVATVRVDSEDRLENVYTITHFLSINFNTNIILTEIGKNPKIDEFKLPKELEYHFILDDNPPFNFAKCNNQIIKRSQTPYIVVYDIDIILPVEQILETLNMLRENKFAAILPYDGKILEIDHLLKAMFMKIQDTKLFEENKNKLVLRNKSYEGVLVFFNRQQYLTAGLDIEDFSYRKVDNIEPIERLSILGLSATRINGCLYHLFHSKNNNDRLPLTK